MNRIRRVLPALLLLGGCATATVDLEEPKLLVGSENAVRVEAEIRVDEVARGSGIPITYQISNERSSSIAVADIVSDSSYDPETRVLTVSVGSEVPGNSLLPRLIEIRPGETKAFTINARMALLSGRAADPNVPQRADIRLRVNFLGDTAPFTDLIGMTEKALADPARADALFPLWLEKNEVIYTNAVPLRLGGSDPADGRRPPPRRPF